MWQNAKCRCERRRRERWQQHGQRRHDGHHRHHRRPTTTNWRNDLHSCSHGHHCKE